MPQESEPRVLEILHFEPRGVGHERAERRRVLVARLGQEGAVFPADDDFAFPVVGARVGGRVEAAFEVVA